CDRKDSPQPPPLLYDLTTLQKTANRRFGFSADHTLKLAQALYATHKAVTYPRTDSRFLTPDMRPQFSGVAQAVSRAPWTSAAQAALAGGMRCGARVIRPSAVTDHHAIIPTLKAPASGRLNRDEERLYDLIVRRFIAAFLPDVVFAKTKLVTEVATSTLGPQQFVTHGKVRRVEGWHLAEPPPSKPPKPKPGQHAAAVSLPNVSMGDAVSTIRAQTRDSQTQPPSRYTEATLLSAMEGAGKELDDKALRAAMRGGGLGTPATRAAIIETLLRRDYITRQKTALVPMPAGHALIDALPNDALRSPELTGRWESRLSAMASGQGEARARFMADVASFTAELVRDIQGATPPEAIASAVAEVLGRCPVCRADVTAGRSAYSCATGRDCSFVIMRQIARRKTSPGLVKLLLAGGASQKLRGFRSKKGKSFNAALRLDAEGKVVFVFDDSPRGPSSAGNATGPSARSGAAPSPTKRPKAASATEPPRGPQPPRCPQCKQGRIMTGRRGWGCTRWREGCGFVVWFEQRGFHIPDDEADRLFSKKQTRLMTGLVPERKARLVLDLTVEGNVRVEFGKRK
ncbi:MAG: DNA topoisomerase-3, partial [Myxococcota bacterium]